MILKMITDTHSSLTVNPNTGILHIMVHLHIIHLEYQ